MRKHLNIKVYGRVQGVFFRVSAQEKALELGISGFARNEPDGSVYIEAEGEEKDLKDFIEWAKKGPRLANIEKVSIEESKEVKYEGFAVK